MQFGQNPTNYSNQNQYAPQFAQQYFAPHPQYAQPGVNQQPIYMSQPALTEELEMRAAIAAVEAANSKERFGAMSPNVVYAVEVTGSRR